jgi:hypothetical protein
MQLPNAQATVVEWGPGPQTVQADRYAIYKQELEPNFRAISGLTGTLWDNYKGSFLLKTISNYWPGRGSTYFYRGIKIVNNTGYALFLPDNSDLEKKLVYYHIKEVSGVTTTQERYQDNLQVYDNGIGYNAQNADGEFYPTAVWVDSYGRLRNDRGTIFRTSNGQSLCFQSPESSSYYGYYGYTQSDCGPGWTNGGVTVSFQQLYNDGAYYYDYVGHTWGDYQSSPSSYPWGTLSSNSEGGGSWSSQDEYLNNYRSYGDMFINGTGRYQAWWTYTMSKQFVDSYGNVSSETSAFQGKQLGSCNASYHWTWVTVRMCYKSSSQGS